MGKLIYSTICSLDGYVEDANGKFDWAAPDEEVLAFVNELERPIGTYLFGRRMYETMLDWESADSLPNLSPGSREFAKIWLAAEKIVNTRTLVLTSSRRTLIEREFDPSAVGEDPSTSCRGSWSQLSSVAVSPPFPQESGSSSCRNRQNTFRAASYY
jgi:dihydrofolate reductase